MRSIGLPELVIVLVTLAVSVIPLIAAAWLLVMVSRIKQDVQDIKEMMRRGPAPG